MRINLKKLLSIILFIVMIAGIVSCRHDDPDIPDNPVRNEQTVIMFFPWSTNLLPYFQRNIHDFAQAVENYGLKDERILICLATSSNKALLLELREVKDKCIIDTLCEFENKSFTTREAIAGLLEDIATLAPANRYAMIIGCHGMGWLPINRDNSGKNVQKLHYEIESGLLTRYFGGLTPSTQIEISTLGDAISDAGMKMEYILFDDCYMSSIEVAYRLREVTDHIIACPTEVLAYGFPYHKCGRYLLGDVDYAGVIDAFYQFYSTSNEPYGTAAVTDCRELDDLADIVRQITFTGAEVNPATIQVMDGYTPSIFFDLGDYIRRICTVPELLEKFEMQLNKAVPYKCHTSCYYSASKGAMPINTFSGITTSAPSVNGRAEPYYPSTLWCEATGGRR